MADETIGEQLGNLGDNARRAKESFISIGQELKDIKSDLNQSNEFFKDLTKSIGQGAAASQKLAEAVERAKNGTASTKVLNRQAADSLAKQKDLQSKVGELLQKAANETNPKNVKLLELAAKRTADAADNAGQLAAGFQAAARANAELDKNAQFFSKLGKLSSQIPGLGKLSGTFNDAAAAIRKSNLEGLEGAEKLRQGFIVLAKAIGIEFLRQLFVVNDEINELQKGLNISRFEAIGVKTGFAAIAFTSNDVAVNSVRIAKANTELNSQLGTAAVFSGELLTTFSKLTEIVGLSSEAAGSLAQQALVSGQEFRTVEENALGTSFALQRASGIALNNKEILEATGKVTGQVRANLGSNPALIAEAVTKAKLLGLEISNIADASKQLLNFESSIGNELEAELLTGKQLNLERARALALQGDLAGVADEIARQNINFSEFGAMNVLQQEALAKAVGMTADGLADSLLKQEVQGRTAKELRAIGKGELADRLEVLSVQQKIALFMEKMQTALGNLAAIMTPVVDFAGNLFGFFSSMPGQILLMVTALAKIIPILKTAKMLSIGDAIAKIFSGNAKFGPLGLAASVAGVAALIATVAQYSKADDMMYGNNMLITKNKGAIALNNDDTIIAGTDLFRGGNIGDSVIKESITSNNFSTTTNNVVEGGISDEQIRKLAFAINDKKVVFDSFSAASPQGIVNTERRRPSNLFF